MSKVAAHQRTEATKRSTMAAEDNEAQAFARAADEGEEGEEEKKAIRRP